MRKERTLLFLGIWVSILSFLGFPKSWREVLFVLTGLSLIYLAYLFYIETKERIAKISNNESKTYIDNMNSGQ